MNLLPKALCFCLLLITGTAFCQTEKKKVAIRKTTASFKIDGILDEAAWKEAAKADSFVILRPTPFQPESNENRSEVYFLYNQQGIYVGGYFHEKHRDSIAAELSGRDGFGNNDFAGIVFDTYNDQINGFEYFITPLGEQWDAKTTTGNEDFSWNAVWESAAKIQSDGWSWEMFLPYSSIRFGKKHIQDWGLNIVRKRNKFAQQLFWQSIDPNKNGFLTQEGLLTGLEGIKPPLRLELSPYFSTYINHDDAPDPGKRKTTSSFNGGADIKFGINQAFTLDMTLIPDFGQVQTDNRVLNLTPFELKFSENRPFFTEGTELFNKGNLFYSRRIGVEPRYNSLRVDHTKDRLVESPNTAKILNATKISGRTQKGLGVGILNAVTRAQNATLQDTLTGGLHLQETMPLTNYNVLVLDQTLKNNSSISLVNTNVTRNGSAYDANVSSFLFDLNDKKNTWNIGGNASISNLLGKNGKNTTGYAHSIYLGKTSGRLGFNIWQDLFNDKYDKSDLGYFTNNNYMEQGGWIGYNWLKPKLWYNQIRINGNFWHSRLVTPMDAVKGKDRMYMSSGMNINGSAQTKKLWWFGFSLNYNPEYNDFYEPRVTGRVFHNKGNAGLNLWYESNFAKKFYWYTNISGNKGGVFDRTSVQFKISEKYRFNSKFSIDHSVTLGKIRNEAGFAKVLSSPTDPIVIFSKRDVTNVTNTVFVKYNFTNKMGLTLRARHYWSKVTPREYYELNKAGGLDASIYNGDHRQNFNFMSMDMIYNWQFAQGSFISIGWKDIAESFNKDFETSYVKNLGNTIQGEQFNSISVKVIYFLDYLTFKNKMKKKSA